jgi:hypothetical protein
MKKFKLIAAVMATCLTASVFANSVGFSSYPLPKDKRMLSTEFVGIASDDGGVGVTGRYTYKYSNDVTFEGGLGIAGGDRSGTIFGAADFKIIPDYARQPKISLKTGFENSEEFNVRRNIFSVTPTASKGFSFWGHEGYPYVAVPVGLKLTQKSQSYESTARLAMGINGRLPFQGWGHLTGNAELAINMKDSYTGVAVGISYPIN